MRIITGTLKGRQIRIPKDVDMRPTTDRTKESIFNRIEARYFLNDAHILDLFSGSGNMSFEAISRGVKHVTAVENNPAHVAIIHENAEKLEISHQINIINSDVLQFLKGPATPFHFIFCDPPYDFAFIDELTELVLNGGWLTSQGWFILEHSKQQRYEKHPNCIFSKKYGRTIVSIFQLNP